MRLPVEVIPERTELIVEIGQMIPHIVQVCGGVIHLVRHPPGDSSQLQRDAMHLLHRVDGHLHLVCLLQRVVQNLLLKIVVHDLRNAALAHHVRQRGVLDGFAIRRVIVVTEAISCTRVSALAILSITRKSAGLRMS